MGKYVRVLESMERYVRVLEIMGKCGKVCGGIVEHGKGVMVLESK